MLPVYFGPGLLLVHASQLKYTLSRTVDPFHRIARQIGFREFTDTIIGPLMVILLEVFLRQHLIMGLHDLLTRAVVSLIHRIGVRHEAERGWKRLHTLHSLSERLHRVPSHGRQTRGACVSAHILIVD